MYHDIKSVEFLHGTKYAFLALSSPSMASPRSVKCEPESTICFLPGFFLFSSCLTLHNRQWNTSKRRSLGRALDSDVSLKFHFNLLLGRAPISVQYS